MGREYQRRVGEMGFMEWACVSSVLLHVVDRDVGCLRTLDDGLRIGMLLLALFCLARSPTNTANNCDQKSDSQTEEHEEASLEGDLAGEELESCLLSPYGSREWRGESNWRW